MGSHLITVSACLLRHVTAFRKSVSAGRDSDLIALLDNLVCLECEWSRHMHSLATPWKLTACRKPLSYHEVSKFPLLYWTQGLIDYARKNLSLARWTASYLCTVLYDSLISCHLYLGFPCGLFFFWLSSFMSWYPFTVAWLVQKERGEGEHQNPRPCLTFCSCSDCPPYALQVGWPLLVSCQCLFNASAGAIQECRRFLPSIASGWLMMSCESVCIFISSSFLKVMTDIFI
jgi:hypothetical protein